LKKLAWKNIYKPRALHARNEGRNDLKMTQLLKMMEKHSQIVAGTVVLDIIYSYQFLSLIQILWPNHMKVGKTADRLNLQHFVTVFVMILEGQYVYKCV